MSSPGATATAGHRAESREHLARMRDAIDATSPSSAERKYLFDEADQIAGLYSQRAEEP
jgi:hypothetical protein